MSTMEEEVKRLVFEDRLSCRVAGDRLGIPAGEVVRIASRLKEGAPNNTPSPQDLVKPGGSEFPSRRLDSGESEIDHLRVQVRNALLTRTQSEEFPATALVRLLQLLEGPRLLQVEPDEQEDADLPEGIREVIFALLDERL